MVFKVLMATPGLNREAQKLCPSYKARLLKFRFGIHFCEYFVPEKLKNSEKKFRIQPIILNFYQFQDTRIFVVKHYKLSSKHSKYLLIYLCAIFHGCPKCKHFVPILHLENC